MAMGGQLEKGLNIDGGTDNTPIGNVSDSLKVTIRDGSANALTSTLTGTKQSLDVNIGTSSLTTYSASIQNLPAAHTSPTDILTITGSSTKKITINQINISGIQTTAGVEGISLIKRSTLNTGGGTGTIVQTQNQFTSTNSTTASVTVTSTGAGNLLIVAAANLDNRNVTGVSDGTSAFTQATSAAGNSGGQDGRCDIWYLTSSNAGKTSVTVTFSGTSTTKQLYFWEVSGSTLAFQTAANTQNQTIANPASGATVNSTAVGIVVGAMVTGSGSTGVITNSPATTNTQFTNGTIGDSGKSAVQWVLGPVDTYIPTYNLTGSGNATGSSTASFTAVGTTVPTITPVPYDSIDAAATAVVKYYFANPSLGTSAGNVRNVKSLVSTSTGAPNYVSWIFTGNFTKGVVLNNENESLNINLNRMTMPGGKLSVDIIWTEQY